MLMLLLNWTFKRNQVKVISILKDKEIKMHLNVVEYEAKAPFYFEM